MRREINLAIISYIANIDEEEVLNQREGEDVADTLTDYVCDAVQKYIKGQKEHGGHISDRDLVAELRNEQIDSMFYLDAMKRKHNL